MLGYKIPYNKGTSSKHDQILVAVMDRVKLSETNISTHFDRWREAEKYYMLYKKVNDKDLKAVSKFAEGETDFTSVVMPYSYAMLLTAHTYMVNVFLNKDPIFQVQGTNGDGVEKEMAMEAMLQYQVKVGDMEVPLFIWLLDTLRYGVGIVGNYWCDEVIPQSFLVEEDEVIDDVVTGKKKTVMKYRLKDGYKGNKMFNILPYDFLPDPRVPYSKLQDGEFVGRKFKLSWNEMVRREKSGLYFNVEECRSLLGSTSKDNERHHSIDQDQTLGIETTLNPKGLKTGDVNAIEMTIEIVPKEWGLSEGEYPEKWVFTIVEKRVIVGCQPLGYLHNKFPIHVNEAEADGYKQEARGLLEVGKPMNDIMTWLFDTHMYNKRQVMNNQFVVDPQRVVMKDLQTKNPGKLIRLKPTAYGQDVRSVISQLPVSDVTTQNYQDVSIVEKQLQRTVGINDDISGQSSPSSRRSATEFRGTTSQSANRLANMAYYFSITGFRSLCQCLVGSTQQMYNVEMKVKVAGDNIKGAESITVNPDDIAGQFDMMAIDGSMPIDRMAQAQFWQQVLMATGQDPELQMQYRRADIFSYMARLAGLKGIDKFKMNVISDEELTALIKQQMVAGVTNGQQQPGAVGASTPNQTPASAGAEDLSGASGLQALLATPGGPT